MNISLFAIALTPSHSLSISAQDKIQRHHGNLQLPAQPFLAQWLPSESRGYSEKERWASTVINMLSASRYTWISGIENIWRKEVK